MECHKKFRDAYTLKDHVQMVHLRIYKFNCEHCKQGFDKLDRLNKHLHMCSAESPVNLRRKSVCSTNAASEVAACSVKKESASAGELIDETPKQSEEQARDSLSSNNSSIPITPLPTIRKRMQPASAMPEDLRDPVTTGPSVQAGDVDEAEVVGVTEWAAMDPSTVPASVQQRPTRSSKVVQSQLAQRTRSALTTTTSSLSPHATAVQKQPLHASRARTPSKAIEQIEESVSPRKSARSRRHSTKYGVENYTK